MTALRHTLTDGEQLYLGNIPCEGVRRCHNTLPMFRVARFFQLPFALVWRKDNTSALLAKFVADVRSLPEVAARKA